MSNEECGRVETIMFPDGKRWSVEELTTQEVWEILDRSARKYLGVTAKEFAEMHDRDELVDGNARHGHLSDLLSMARQAVTWEFDDSFGS